jgi:hypothetical protein
MLRYDNRHYTIIRALCEERFDEEYHRLCFVTPVEEIYRMTLFFAHTAV